MKSTTLAVFIFLLTALLLLLGISVFAQSQQAFKYQAIVRGNSGEILQNQQVGIRISIHDATAGGTIVYQETFIESTNDFGLVNLKIGTGNPAIGIFANIDWGSDPKFLETEIDDGGGYVSIGTSELLSVPYAKVADVSRDAVWEKADDDIYSSNSGNVGIGTSAPGGKLGIFTDHSTSGKGLVIRDGMSNTGIDFEIAEFLGLPKFRVMDNGTTILGHDSKGIQMRTDGIFTDIESLGTDLAINYQSGNNTYLNVTSGNVAIGTTNLDAKLKVYSLWEKAVSGYAQYDYGVYGYSPSFSGVVGESSSGPGVHGISLTGYAGFFEGNVSVIGSISKGGGSFLIDHPLDPENKLLRHNFVESPENLLIYRGKAELNSNGEATVRLPDYFKALTKEEEASIHLTPVGRPFLTGAEWNDDFSAIIIYGDNNREVFWEVLADRDDPVIHELGRPVEEEKGGDKSLCEKGKLFYPKAYGYPESLGRDYERNQLNK